MFPLSPWMVGREMDHISYYISQLSESWPGKVALSTVLTISTEIASSISLSFRGALHNFSAAFGADSFLLVLLFALMCADLALGLVWAFVKRKFSREIFVRGVSKYPLYCLYLFLVGAVGAGIDHSINIGLPVLNLFTAYLVASEAFSVVKNLERLGVKIPPLLLFVVNGFRDKVERTLHDGFKTIGADAPEKKTDKPQNKKELDNGID